MKNRKSDIRAAREQKRGDCKGALGIAMGKACNKERGRTAACEGRQGWAAKRIGRDEGSGVGGGGTCHIWMRLSHMGFARDDIKDS